MIYGLPTKRLLAYLMVLALFPVLLVGVYHYSQSAKISRTHQSVLTVLGKLRAQEMRQSTNNLVRLRYRDADRFYIDKNLETLSLRSSEIEALEAMLGRDSAADVGRLQQRLDFLRSDMNKLRFTESAVQTHANVQEVYESLARPVQVHRNDLCSILSLVEGSSLGDVEVPPHKPQLIVLELNLSSSHPNAGLDLLNMKLLKREYL